MIEATDPLALPTLLPGGGGGPGRGAAVGPLLDPMLVPAPKLVVDPLFEPTLPAGPRLRLSSSTFTPAGLTISNGPVCPIVPLIAGRLFEDCSASAAGFVRPGGAFGGFVRGCPAVLGDAAVDGGAAFAAVAEPDADDDIGGGGDEATGNFAAGDADAAAAGDADAPDFAAVADDFADAGAVVAVGADVGADCADADAGADFAGADFADVGADSAGADDADALGVGGTGDGFASAGVAFGVGVDCGGRT